MGKIGKTVALILTLTIAMSCLTLLVVNPVNAQTITKPAMPEFSLKYVDYSYDIPSEYGIDQFTGQKIVTRPGQHIDNRTVQIIIKNQPFNNFTDFSSGKAIDLFYNVRFRGAFTYNWTEIYGGKGKMIMYNMDTAIALHGYPTQTYGSQFTTLLFPVSNIPNNVQLNFQVNALEGYADRFIQDSRILFSIVDYEFTGQESGWSNTQTITIGETSPSTPNPTSPSTTIPPVTTPTQRVTPSPTLTAPDIDTESTGSITLPLYAFAAIIGVIIVLSVALSVLLFRRQQKSLT